MKLLFVILILVQHGWAAPAVLFPDELGPRIAREAGARLPTGAELNISNIRVNHPIPTSATLRLPTEPPIGLVELEASWVEDGAVKKAVGSALIQAHIPVAVTRAPVQHGETFGDANVRFEQRDITAYLQSGYINDRHSLENLRARGYLRPGTVLGASNTQAPFAITQGQPAELTWKAKGLVITAKVKALDNGNVSQWIRVLNPITKKTLTAQVTGPSQLSLR